MKKIVSIVLIMCLVASLVACNKKEKKSQEGFVPSLDKDTECSITIVGSYDNFEALEAEFDRFNKIYPNVQLSYMKLDDYKNILSTVLEGENKPDIFFSYTWMIGNDKYKSVVKHMEDLSDSNLGLNLNCIRQGLINRDADGHVMMVPIFSRSYGMLVNNDLFEKEGIAVPTTWSELLSSCEELKDKGYVSPMMGYSSDSSSCFMYTIAYPRFMVSLAENSVALSSANNLEPSAGEYLRPALDTVDKLISKGCFNLEECDKIKNNYTDVILRFFEGDVPMMVCAADTVSGTKKRESQSETFAKSPFKYSFYPIPLNDGGGYFIDSPSVEFSVNKDSDNLNMANEFMRFLISDGELSELASVKRLITPTNNMSFDSVYSPFGKVPSDRIISPEVLGITDPLTVQVRIAAYKVGKGELSIDEAVKKYGSFE